MHKSHRDVFCLIWWALAWDEDWFPVCTVYSTITVSSTLNTLLEFGGLDRWPTYVPSGLIPDCHPRGGARAVICALVGVVVLLDDVVTVFVADEGGADEDVCTGVAAGAL